jgi:hypothetical protein
MEDVKRGVLAADAAMESGYWPFQVTGTFAERVCVPILCTALFKTVRLISTVLLTIQTDNGVTATFPPELDDEGDTEMESLPWEKTRRIHFAMCQLVSIHSDRGIWGMPTTRRFDILGRVVFYIIRAIVESFICVFQNNSTVSVPPLVGRRSAFFSTPDICDHHVEFNRFVVGALTFCRQHRSPTLG